MSHDEKILIRTSTTEDAIALHRLAALDSSEPIGGRALVAEVNGSIRAALPLDGSRPISDPFAESEHVMDLLRAHERVLPLAA
ncbi:MAG: hypothetical protein QOD53_1719 [Thermoleophilaceae bacterium]|jgi:hypothetical protein|nr:hypothetical protein [Thermoleophilaceae bacterium]